MVRKSWRRRLAIAVGGLVCVGVVLFIVGEGYKRRDFLPYFLETKSELVRVTEEVLEEGPDATVMYIALEDEGSIMVEGHLKIPVAGGPLHPVIITLGGVGTGRRTIDYLGDTRDWLVLALDYPYHGDRSNMSHREFLGVLPEARRAMLDTVPAGMLALDYLWRRDDVDRDRVVLAGGSFGALFSPALAAADQRVTAVAIFFGAGDLQELIDANLEMPWPVKPIVGWLGSVIVSPLEPLKYIHAVSPRPLFMLNGTEDEAMPVHCSRVLHERAGDPKTIRWLPLGHVHIRSIEFHQRVLDVFMGWLREIDYLSDEEPFRLRP